MNRFLSFLRSLALLVTRLGLGGILLLHGTRRWQSGIASQVEYLNQFEVPYPQAAAWAAVTFEVVGGVFLILGALTPLIGVAVLAQQVLTICWTNYYRGPDLLAADGTYAGGFEYNIALALLGLLLAVLGGGTVSLDKVFRRRRPVLEDTFEPSTTPERVRV